MHNKHNLGEECGRAPQTSGVANMPLAHVSGTAIPWGQAGKILAFFGFSNDSGICLTISRYFCVYTDF
jgi:hypothetical protein